MKQKSRKKILIFSFKISSTFWHVVFKFVDTQQAEAVASYVH